VSADSPFVAGQKSDPLLTPGEVAKRFRVDPRTVLRWEHEGKIPCVRTLGGHRRYRTSEIFALLKGENR
jgi:excisionase family DNA binding protein